MIWVIYLINNVSDKQTITSDKSGSNRRRTWRSKPMSFVLLIISPIYLLVKLIPKNRKLYVYGSSLGLHFADNSKYLFLHASKKADHIKSVFISKNKSLVKSLINNQYKAEYLYSFKGILAVIRAKKAFLSHSVEDIHPLLLGGTEIIQLWHGTPLKMIGYDADWKYLHIATKIRRRILYFLFPFLYGSQIFDKMIVSSEEISKTYKTAFGIRQNKIEIIGQPRNDCLNPEFNLDNKIFREIEFLHNLKKRFSKIVAWLPTHRGLSDKTMANLMDDYGFDSQKFDKFLKKNNIGFVAKPHFLEKDILKAKTGISQNFIVYDYVDPYPLLRYTDVLITDYSSVYFDFLLTERPLIFAPFDFGEYCQNNADIYYDYDDVTPGPKCRDWNEIMVELRKLIEILKYANPDPYADRRREICDRFNYYKNGFCERIINRFFKPNL